MLTTKFRTVFSLTAAFVLIIVFALPVFAVEYTPGVSKGQYVKYGNFVGIGTSLHVLSLV